MNTNDSNWSAPETEVFEIARDMLAADRRAVLATVVAVEGSAYRRPGAKMIVTADGDVVGHITAGCLEDEVRSLAREVLDAGRPRVETYDLMEDDDIWGLGVGCNGILDILLEPLDETHRPALDAYADGGRVAVVTVLDGDADVSAGARAYYDPETDAMTSERGPFPDWLAEAVRGPAATLIADDRTDTLRVTGPDGTVEVLVDAVVSPPELVVLGSGHDVGPIVELAARNDFRVTVVGFRGAIDLDARFPAADETLTTSPADVLSAHEFDERTYAVVATHNFVDDRLALGELLDAPVPYVGLMGPRERFAEMRQEFEAEGRPLSEADLDRIYTPLGLDLGGTTPYQIAHSAVAEVLAVHNGRRPRHLRDREESIHERPDLDEDAPAADTRS